MKRWSVLFLALALWALAGCGGPAADEGAAGEAPSVFAEASAPDAEGGLSAVRLEGQARPLTDEEIAAACRNIYERRAEITTGYRITFEAPILRHFTVELDKI